MSLQFRMIIFAMMNKRPVCVCESDTITRADETEAYLAVIRAARRCRCMYTSRCFCVDAFNHAYIM